MATATAPRTRTTAPRGIRSGVIRPRRVDPRDGWPGDVTPWADVMLAPGDIPRWIEQPEQPSAAHAEIVHRIAFAIGTVTILESVALAMHVLG